MIAALYHLANPEDTVTIDSNNEYTVASLHSEGFIHCCTEDQLTGVVQRYYQQAQQLVLLSINPDKLTAKLVFENTVGGSELFPHIYGPINAAAIESQQHWKRSDIEQRLADGPAES